MCLDAVIGMAVERGAAAGLRGSPPGHDADAVGHDGHPVQRGLPVEEHDVAVLQVPLHRVAHLQRSRALFIKYIA